MRSFRIWSVILGILLIGLCTQSIACDKTAENTNKPLFITNFIYTVEGAETNPKGILQIGPGEILTIEVEYTDPDAGPDPDPAWYTFLWAVERVSGTVSEFNPNEFFIVNDENPCIWTAPTVTGFYHFMVDARDKYMTPSFETITIEVNSNKRPTINLLEVSENMPFVNELVTINVEATDPDGNVPLEYGWSATGGYFTYETDGEARWLSPESGSYQVTIVITDQAGGNVSRSIPIIVQENHPPVIVGFNLDPGNSVAFGQLVIITLDVGDIDGDTLEFNWSSDIGSFNSITKYVAVWRAPWEPSAANISCIVDDGKGGSDTVDIVIIVEG